MCLGSGDDDVPPGGSRRQLGHRPRGAAISADGTLRRRMGPRLGFPLGHLTPVFTTTNEDEHAGTDHAGIGAARLLRSRPAQLGHQPERRPATHVGARTAACHVTDCSNSCHRHRGPDRHRAHRSRRQCKCARTLGPVASRRPRLGSICPRKRAGRIWIVDEARHVRFTAGALALAYTAYCLLAPRLKERRFAARYGDRFSPCYRAAVPYALPRPLRAKDHARAQ